MSLVNEFIEWASNDPEAAAKKLGTFSSVVNRWLAGSHKPPLAMIEKYFDLKQKDDHYLTAGMANLLPGTEKSQRLKTVQKKKAVAVVQEAKPEPPIVVSEPMDAPVPEAKPDPDPEPEKPKLTGEWEGRNLMVLFPCYRLTNAATAWALVALALDFGKEKIRFDMELGDAMIYHSRNRLADKFLKSGCEWSLWLDDDIIPPIGRPDWFRFMGRLPAEYPKPATALHCVHRLMSHKKTIVGATYYGRHPGGPPMFADMHKPEAVRDARAFKDGIRATEWVATGCLLVHRQVYLDIQKKFPNLAPNESHPWQKEFDFFLPEPGQGEDVAFGKRALAAGHQSYVDTGLQCLHLGWCSYQALNTGQVNMGMSM